MLANFTQTFMYSLEMELYGRAMSRNWPLCPPLEMSKIEQMKAFVNQRLTAAADEIFGAFENIMKDYEVEDLRSKREIERQNKLLDIFLKPEIKLPRAGLYLYSYRILLFKLNVYPVLAKRSTV